MRPKCGGTEVAATLLFHCLDAPFPLLCSLPLTVPNCACSLTPLIRQRRTLTSRTILPVFTAPCHTFVFGCPSLARVRYVRAGRWGPFVPLGRSGGWRSVLVCMVDRDHCRATPSGDKFRERSRPLRLVTQEREVPVVRRPGRSYREMAKADRVAVRPFGKNARKPSLVPVTGGTLHLRPRGHDGPGFQADVARSLVPVTGGTVHLRRRGHYGPGFQSDVARSPLVPVTGGTVHLRRRGHYGPGFQSDVARSPLVPVTGGTVHLRPRGHYGPGFQADKPSLSLSPGALYV
ncbi:hypothetical protein T09_7770 [Trichinella sp. T9]|nr:hypothetical protein T09_7770 [Trichinella sp. T9]